MFVVLQCDSSSPDVFRILFLPTNCSTIDRVPPSTYSVYLYGLDANGLPKESPDYQLKENLTVSGESEVLCVNACVFECVLCV